MTAISTLSPPPPAGVRSGESSPLPKSLASGLTRRNLSGLDGLRAVAALLVVFDHAGLTLFPGGLGVLAFFVLSGFLITWLIIAEEDLTSSVSLSRFYVRRSFRIFPAFYAYFFLGLTLITVLHKEVNTAQAITAFFYVTNYYQAILGDPSTWLSHTWSLAVEEQFYLLWPVTFLLLRNNGRRFRVLAVAIPVLWLYRESLIFVFHVKQNYIYEAFDTRADHLLMGCFLAVSLREGRLARFWRMACASPWLTWLTIALLIACVAVGRFIDMADYRDAVEFVVEPVLIFVLIGQLIASQSSAATAPFNWRWMRYLGRLSYSIYLYQQLLIYAVVSRLRSTPTLAVIVTLAVVIVAAACSYHLVERPFLRLRDRIAARKDQSGAYLPA
jgi:peptidoglycan/LPS O-acetylase OafA/YrhL